MRHLLPALLAVAGSAQEPQQGELEALQRNVERLIERHAHFPRLGLEPSWNHGEFAFLVQVPGTAGPDYMQQVLSHQEQSSQALDAAFEALLGAPLELRLRPGAARMVTVVLASPQDFAEYYRVSFAAEAGGRDAYYDPGNRLLVVCESAVERTPQQRLFERHERALQILHAHGASALGLPGPYWFQQGLAGVVAGRADFARLAADGLPAEVGFLHVLAEVLSDPEQRQARLLSCAELFAQTSALGVLETLNARAEAQALPPVDGWLGHGTFVAQAGALLHYLLREADADLRARTSALCAEAMRTTAGDVGLVQRHFAEVDLIAVEAGFWAWAGRLHARTCPLPACRGAHDLEAFLVERFGQQPFARMRLAPVAYEAEDLMRELEDADGRLALALAYFERGQAGIACQLLLEGIEDKTLTGDTRRLMRELARVEAWIEQRDAFLEHLVSSGELLRLEQPELQARVVRIEAERLVFEEEALAPLAIDELEPLQLARAMTARRSRFEASWGALVPLVIAGEDGIERLLKGDDVQVRMLASDRERDYLPRRAGIAAAQHWRALLEGEGDMLQHIGALWAARSEVPFVGALEQGLLGLARRELAARGMGEQESLQSLVELGFDSR